MAVLLLGNGINQNEKLMCAWDELLKSALEVDSEKNDSPIFSSATIGNSNSLPSVDGLTMTLGFDLLEIYAIDHTIAENSTDLKQKIAENMRRRMDTKTSESGFKWEDTIHWRIMTLPINTFLTTNYDYALEKSADSGFKIEKGSNETIYSRYRKHTINVGSERKTIYHIHGELHVPKSICLGFEHYSGSLEKMRSDLVRSTKNTEDSGDRHTYHLCDVLMGLKKENGQDEDDGSWYLKFFNEDVYILGLSLDFSEQDLWWLLDFRIRKIKYENNDLEITNKIYFFDTDSSGLEFEGKYAARNALLRAFGVEIIYLSGDEYNIKYRQAMDIINIKEGNTMAINSEMIRYVTKGIEWVESLAHSSKKEIRVDLNALEKHMLELTAKNRKMSDNLYLIIPAILDSLKEIPGYMINGDTIVYTMSDKGGVESNSIIFEQNCHNRNQIAMAEKILNNQFDENIENDTFFVTDEELEYLRSIKPRKH